MRRDQAAVDPTPGHSPRQQKGNVLLLEAEQQGTEQGLMSLRWWRFDTGVPHTRMGASSSQDFSFLVTL